jgi:UDP-glucose 4-epimerase
MKIALFGHRGFIGGNLKASKIFASDDFLPFDLSRNSSSTDQNLRAVLQNCDAIIWAAGSVNPLSAELRPDLVRDEIDEFKRVVSIISNQDPSATPKFVFLSSGGCTYTANTLPFREEDQALGINSYGKMKIEQENYLVETLRNSVIARLSNIYGPGQPAGRGQGVIAEWYNALKLKRDPQVYGNLNSTRDYLHIYDLISALYFVTRGEIDGIVNIGSGKETALGELMDIFRSILPSSSNFSISERRAFDRSAYYLSINKIGAKLGWFPKVELKHGIKSLLDTLSNE